MIVRVVTVSLCLRADEFDEEKGGDGLQSKPAPRAASAGKTRLESLDAFRGLTIAWMIFVDTAENTSTHVVCLSRFSACLQPALTTDCLLLFDFEILPKCSVLDRSRGVGRHLPG